MSDERERELERALGVRSKCGACHGEGYVLVSVQVCCGRVSKSGECCNEPEEQQDAGECASCMGSGEVVG